MVQPKKSYQRDDLAVKEKNSDQKELRVVFCGTPDFASAALEALKWIAYQKVCWFY